METAAKPLQNPALHNPLRERASCLRGYLNPKYSLLSCTKTSSNTYVTLGEDMCSLDHEQLFRK